MLSPCLYADDTQGTSAADLGLTELTDDLSRQDLFKIILASELEGAKDTTQYFNLNNPFKFPNHVDFDDALNKPRVDSLFGIDISHYTSKDFPIDKLPSKKVKFLYMKATQGTKSLDGKFADFWSKAKTVRVHRGAYHFLSSTDTSVPQGEWNDKEAADWGKAQAKTFIKVIKANGGILSTDMPPVVDLEWDKAKADSPDRWGNRPSSQIFAMIDAFLAEVKSQLNRTPMIYTAQAWWNERMGRATPLGILSTYPLWLADYSKRSRKIEDPRTINNSSWVLWQFTDSAKLAQGFNNSFDANIFKGKTKYFYSSLNVKEFE